MSSPFQVKTFRRSGDIAEALNAWFDTIAADPENEYDIRQILDLGIALLVFYERNPVDVVPDCAACTTEEDRLHTCTGYPGTQHDRP